jgi:anti-sigma regulatory factor (Ser/Thr protein kinase)
MDLRNLILKEIKDKKRLKVSDIVQQTGFSRVYVHRFFRDLVNKGEILRAGKATQAHYLLTGLKTAERLKKSILKAHRILQNANLSEDTVLREIKDGSSIFADIPSNVETIVDYAFSEILNNAIEHSQSKLIDVVMERTTRHIRFDIADKGVGIFANIMEKKKLKNHMEAIQDLLKGKQTTLPEAHSGEGIFFTSRVTDMLRIRSSDRKLVFDNVRDDVFLANIQPTKGTKVFCSIAVDSKRELSEVFKAYTDDSFEFNKTSVRVKLFRQGVEYLSRSQARRIVVGLERFKSVELDFRGIDTIGQGFADEIFRVWRLTHPGVRIIPVNAIEIVLFMIRHVAPDLQLVYNSDSRNDS